MSKLPVEWPWPNSRLDVDYATLSPSDVRDLDSEAVGAGLLPKFDEPMERLRVCKAAPAEMRSALDRAAHEAGIARMHGNADRARICAHSWHRIRERFVWPDGIVATGHSSWVDMGMDSAGSCVYDTF